MAIFAATDFLITINAVDFTNHCNSVDLPISVAELDSTVFGPGWTSAIGGLKSAQFTVNLLQDYAASQVDGVLWPLLGTVVSFAVRPTSAAKSATNPEYSGNVLVSHLTPVGGKVGDLAVQQLQWKVSGPITRAIA